MTNTADGTSWTITEPGDTDPRNEGATEIRGLRAGVGIRMDREHVTLAGSSVGGEHKAGSAVSYRQSGAPTTRPDGVSLTSADNGRLWVDDADEKMYVYVHTSWVAVAPSVLGADVLAVASVVFTDMITGTGWTNGTGSVVMLIVSATRSNSNLITVQVENTLDNFVTVATGQVQGTTGYIQTSVLVPNANHARLLVNGATVGGGWSGIAHRIALTLT